ncbi:MAG: excinuclease ABC subunit UvrA [Nanoarchaeota archaeon]|jgi:excinuclease ABC subunit A|nr:excinuclease ABC subunit UvrA [Nanoarchaeota archaeon]
MASKDIVIKGARQHNLKNFDLTLPKEKFIVITGLSGSGKSTLAFDTLYAEGQRRYVESLSAYARQFLGLMSKPDVDSIEGLSPAISIEQKTTSKNPRSTVGTVTEIYDYLRLLYARIGTPFCPNHNEPIISQTPQEIVEKIQKEFKEQVTILSPIIRQKKGTYEQLVQDLNKEGYARIRLNGKLVRTDEKLKLSRYEKHDIDAVIDRINTEDTQRLTEAVENALKKSDGLLILQNKEGKDKLYSANMTCPKCDTTFEELQPRMFSFNSPFGACEECHGLGVKIEFDPELIIPNKKKPIIAGAIECYPKMDASWRNQQLAAVGKKYKFDLFTLIENFTKKQLDILLYGTEEPIRARWPGGADMHMEDGWEGVIPQQERLHRETQSDYRRKELEKYMRASTCPDCKGKRLKEKILSVKINEKSIIEVTELSIKDTSEFFKKVKLTAKEAFIAKQVLKEINERLEFLNNVGLSYLNLSRSAGTLSGGEAQRIRLATQIGSNLTGVLYVLDEPSIGLHQRDNSKLIQTLHKLRDLGNTLIVVEHDEDTIRAADYVVDIGPGAGIHGGEIVAKGTPKEIEKNKESLTGQYLRGKQEITIPKQRREKGIPIQIIGAEQNNLKNINVDIPTQCLTLVTGVSGSGKSTLINEILSKGMSNKINKASKDKPGKHKAIKTDAYIDKVIVIDQSPIGRTPRSNPATYTKIFDEVRTVFSETKEAKMRGYKPGRFSFNVKGGRCEKCQGDGTIKIEMNFLPDVYVECEECKGGRYNRETLEVKYKGKSIAEVLGMSVEEALEVFQFIPNIRKKLQTLVQVGLDYVKLGQSATTLSGGESQRIKLTKELAKRSTGRTLYILDEPTTGLHFHDVKRLIYVLQGLVDKGNTMVIIEHNLDVIKCADHIIDLGPEGGVGGGQIIATGTPEEVSKIKASWTGKYLKKVLARK